MKNEVTTQHPVRVCGVYLRSSEDYRKSGLEIFLFFFTKQDGGRKRGEGLREALQRDSCDSCDSFQGRGI